MKKIFRFMSIKEFEKYKSGERLFSDKKHIGRTNSVGFCFLDMKDYSPEEAYHFLNGIVSTEVCVIFETDEVLEEHEAEYASPISFEEYRQMNLLEIVESFLNPIPMTINEYCLKEYDNKKLKIIKYCRNFDDAHTNNKDWKWLSDV